ncbi:endonuclease III [Candidatus Izemoplasma sp. B36]|uniref:endonuclease III n=1 Tax=Candidatus Izemoplasma sp. B36 TaxID=3242468 RepID=UPI0035570089
MGKELTKSQFIYNEISKLFPDAKCELNYYKDFELLIAIMLSAQTTDIAVNKVTENLFNKYHSIEDYANAEIEDLEQIIRKIGLYRNKSKNLKLMAKMVVDMYDSNIPKTQKELEQLPGVGRKTANVFLAEFYHIPRIAVDTHVSRVSKRLGLAKESDNPLKIEEKLKKRYNKSLWISLHHKFIFFGRYFCKAKKPNCKECPVIKYCKKPWL